MRAAKRTKKQCDLHCFCYISCLLECGSISLLQCVFDALECNVVGKKLFGQFSCTDNVGYLFSHPDTF